MKHDFSELVQKFQYKELSLTIDKSILETSIQNLFNILFPLNRIVNNQSLIKELDSIYNAILGQLKQLNSLDNPFEILNDFFDKLPELQTVLYQDARAFLANDPAANSIEEIIIAYPGFYALAIHRMSHLLYNLKVPIIPRLWSEYVHSKGGIDIHPGAKIGARFFLDHGTGVVIGETTVIGNDVKIYQNVTLGALHVSKEMAKIKRHPTVEDNVIIYSGATILGGETILGNNSTIGGNAWVTRSVDPFSLVYYSSKMKIKNTQNTDKVINYII